MGKKLTRICLASVLAVSAVFSCANRETEPAVKEESSTQHPNYAKVEQKQKTAQGSTPKAKSNISKNQKPATRQSVPDVVEKVMPSVVKISTTKTIERQLPPLFSPFGGQMPGPKRKFKRRGLGSGVIVDKDGTIITNNHVVAKADEIKVKLNNGEEYDAKITGRDPQSDVAIVKLKKPPKDLKPIAFGNSDKVRLGETVLAIGSPFGLSSSVSKGIISAKGRYNVGIVDYENFIQTDAAINPGNSGGALVDLDGKLVGINTAIASKTGGYQGIGFAIPANMAEQIMNSLLEHGEVERGWLGVHIQTLSAKIAPSFDVSKDKDGVVITNVENGSPADKAGFKRGDVVVEFAGESIDSAKKLQNVVGTKQPGQKAKVIVLRDGSKKKLTVTLGKRPESPKHVSEFKSDGMLQGLVLGPLDSKARSRFNQIPDGLENGVVVMDIQPRSPAARSGLKPGDVILEINRKEVKNVKHFKKLYRKAGSRVLLLVQRESGRLFLAFEK